MENNSSLPLVFWWFYNIIIPQPSENCSCCPPKARQLLDTFAKKMAVCRSAQQFKMPPFIYLGNKPSYWKWPSWNSEFFHYKEKCFSIAMFVNSPGKPIKVDMYELTSWTPPSPETPSPTIRRVTPPAALFVAGHGSQRHWPSCWCHPSRKDGSRTWPECHRPLHHVPLGWKNHCARTDPARLPEVKKTSNHQYLYVCNMYIYICICIYIHKYKYVYIYIHVYIVSYV